VHADAAVVVEIADGAVAKVVAGSNVPPEFIGLSFDADVVSEVGAPILAACGKKYAHAEVIPLVSGGGLFGALVLLSTGDASMSAHQRMLAEGIVELGAIALAKAASLALLARQNAELRASREVLARSEKLRALGEMAAGVSHDLKNILNPLSLHLQLLKRELVKHPIGKDAEESVAEMQGVIRRGVETIDRLREFSRQTPDARLTPVDPNTLVAEAVRLAHPHMATKGVVVDVVQELGKAPPVVVRPADLVSAILNLLVNAIDAMPQGGKVIITTGEANGGGFVRVKDTGPGMPPEVEKRVFEPFFSTKGNAGTGLGLAMVYAFVRRHGGSITLETAPAQGATFTLSFPPPDDK
jgi:signal transduction histidine kinase